MKAIFVMKKIKKLVFPIWNSKIIILCRWACFTFLDKITGYYITKRRFKKKVGYDLDLKNPKSLNQKIIWKKINDRNPLLPLVADKYLVREYVKNTLGENISADILVPLLHVVDKPEMIPFNTLSGECIIKTNHDSGGSVIIYDKDSVDKKEIVSKFEKLMSVPYGILKHEWAYWPIKKKIIIEKLLRDTNGDLAQDYKFHVFHGKCRFIHTTPKINGVRTGKRSLFTPDWKQLPVGWKHPQGPYIKPPEKLKEMLELAEKLGAAFDYVRVDFYNPSGRIYFGELTHYHGSGQERFYPESFDFEAGKYWDIMPDYWEKSNNGTK